MNTSRLLICNFMLALFSSPAIIAQRASPASDNPKLTVVKPAENPSAAPASKVPWTILVYGAADNNADGPILTFMHSLRKALDDDAGVELIFFVDRSDKYSADHRILGEDFTGARLYRLRRQSAERLSGGMEFPEIKLESDVELDTADATNLRKFVAWGKAHYPAQRTMLLIYSHASGQTMCPDEQSGRDMGIAELTHELTADQRVDVLALELCSMGGIEISYQWRPGSGGFEADYLVAIPNAGPPLDWHRAFRRIRSPGHASSTEDKTFDPATMTAEEFGRLVVDEGYKGRLESAQNGGGTHESAACYDLRLAADVKKSVDALAVALAKHDGRGEFMKLRDQCINYSEDGPFVDLFDLCTRAAVNDGFRPEIRAAAQAVAAQVDRFILTSFGMSHYTGFQPGKHGVFIVLPPDRPGAWSRFTWYTPLSEPAHYGRWAFLADGATPANGVIENWFEMLDSWLDIPDDAGDNEYRP